MSEARKTNEEVLKYIRHRNSIRKKAVMVLLSEGFPLREIGRLLGLTGQRVGALVRYWELRDEART